MSHPFRVALVCALALISLPSPKAFATSEICGNGIDDDGNGMTDEGCYPSLTTGVCESPLSCGDTGMVSWSTGSLHYDLPPDIAPAVPFGPGIGLRRFYTSMYSPNGTNPTSVNHTPLGPNWQHTYMTWLYAYSSGGNKIILHTSQGRDVLYSDSGPCGSYECYAPQAGDHVLKLYVDTTNTLYYVQLLTGETLKYNSVGQLIEIWDTMPTPNKVVVTWTSTSNGNVDTVTDASGQRRLQFFYTNNLLAYVQFQTKDNSGKWNAQHQTTYDYTYGVTRDATSQWFVPQTASEWTNLLQGTGIPNPTDLWKCQETSGNLADSIGSATLTATNNGGMSYAQSVTGWTRKAVALTENQTSNWASGSTLCNPKTTQCTALGIIQVAQPTAQRDLFTMGDSNGARVDVNGHTISTFHYVDPEEVWKGTTTSGSSSLLGTTVFPWIVSADPTNLFTTMRVGSITATPTWATGTSANGTFTMGKVGLNSAAVSYLYMAEWAGTALTSAQQLTVYNRILNGAGLSRVTIGSQLAQLYTYDGNGYLTNITDGGGTPVVTFKYSSTTSGQVDLITTPRGTVGFEFSSSRSGCTGNTMLYFNQGNTTLCSVDGDCGSGFICGGKTGSGTTGTCFLAGRCLTTSTVNGESVITNVAPIGPGGTCSGACTDVMQYSWATPTSLLNVIGREDPLTNYTSATYNTNGLPTQIGYGDNNADPTDGGTNRTEWRFYDSTFPGRLIEVRRPSDLSSNASSCSGTSIVGCQRTKYCYGNSCSASCNNDNQLCTVEQAGWTLDATGATVTFDNVITYIHDTKGRISEIDGAVSGIKTIFDYNTGGTGNLQDDFLHDYKTYTDATHYLQPLLTTYDFWGHPTSLKAPDGNFTCDAYDSSRGFLATRVKAFLGETDCSTVARGHCTPSTTICDLATDYARDSWLRLTSLQRPDGSYLQYTYNAAGQLSQTKRLDAIGAVGDYQTFNYTTDGQVSGVDTHNAAGTLTAQQTYTYFASRRLQEIVNPVVSGGTAYTGLVYDTAGKLTEVDGESSLSKTVYHFDGAPGHDNRVTSVEKFRASLSSDTWSLLYAWLGDQSQVTDGDSKVTGSTRDDIGRLVKLTSPDLAGPTVRVFDAASRLTTMVEDLGGGTSQVTSSFTYDNLGRQLTADYGPRCRTGSGTNPTITRSFDAIPTGVTCPAGMVKGCTSNVTGRVAYVQTVLLCDTTDYTDGSLDQQTFYAYDGAGRVIEEYITDDGGRTADHQYTHTNNGALLSFTTPSGAVIGWTYGSSNASDLDRVTAITRGDTTVVDSVQWAPYGPWTQYNWEASIGGTLLRNRVARNKAYRITNVYGAELQTGVSNSDEVDISEDAMGRATSRVYTPHDPTFAGLFDQYWLYDEQSRVTCETTDLVSTCPTTGSDMKAIHSLSPPFKSAGDWKRILHRNPGSSGWTNDFNTSGTNYGTSHQVTDVNQNDGSVIFGHTAFAYDVRGNRTYDDNTTTNTNDRRDYTYDGRRNVINVRGQYRSGSAWHYYDVASAFDAQNRRVFKSFYDETTAKTATWFFYYDSLGRPTEVKYTPDTSSSGTYSSFQLFWLGSKLVFYWQTDYPSVTTSKRYVTSDETDRPLKLWTWPSSGDSSRAWAIDPRGWGLDKNLVGPSVYQPFLFAGQYQDVEAVALENDGATVHRPGPALNGYRTYDPFTGGYLQVDPLVPKTWSSYVYVDSNPVGNRDPSGLLHFSNIGGDTYICSDKQDEGFEVSDDGYFISDPINCQALVGGEIPPPPDPTPPWWCLSPFMCPGGVFPQGGGVGPGPRPSGWFPDPPPPPPPPPEGPGDGIVICECECEINCYGQSVSVSVPFTLNSWKSLVDAAARRACRTEAEEACMGAKIGLAHAVCTCNEMPEAPR